MKKILIKLGSFVLSKISFKAWNVFMYLISYRRFPDLKKPKLFSEKMTWLLLNKYKNDPLVAKCADKVAVRDYIASKGYEYILNEIYGIWDDASKIEWEKLPEKFVLKCNHASGLNFICKDKSKINVSEVINLLNKWLHVEYWKRGAEIFYKNIPKRIICEKYIETSDGKPPKDYKFFCSKGKVKFLFVASDRYNNQTKFNFFTPDWTPIDVIDKEHPPYKGEISKPDNLSEMIRIAEDLSTPWELVRIDFYNENNKIIFGEITFMHHGGKPQFSPKRYDAIFGEMFDIF